VRAFFDRRAQHDAMRQGLLDRLLAPGTLPPRAVQQGG
jgi:hypothetical protein